MADTSRIRQRIQAKISQGEFLGNLLRIAKQDSTAVQAEFLETLSNISAGARDIFLKNDMIGKIVYQPGDYWVDQRGKTLAFIDAGVANIDLPSAAPVGIRVGSYIVRPGDETEKREQFRIELALVDELYSPKGELYDDEFEDLAKLRDAARIVSETAAAFRLSRSETPIDTILLHGPLINPVSPYGLRGFPAFGEKASREFRMDAGWVGTDEDRQFIPTYSAILDGLKACGVPAFGVVERSIGKYPIVTWKLLCSLQDKSILKASDVKGIIEKLVQYGLNDTALLDVVLEAGEYTRWIPVDRQGPPNKWPDEWKAWIRKLPNALTTYLKPSETVLPFRVETFEGNQRIQDGLDLIMHTSRLLPSYGFPVGLDIVDKFAKVPAWMSRGVRGQHQVVLLRKALESGDKKTMAYAMRVLTAQGRDWLFRPQA